MQSHLQESRTQIEWSSDRATRRVARTPSTMNDSAVVHATARGRTPIAWTSPKTDPPMSEASATTLIEIESIQLPEGTNGDAGTRAGVASLALARPKSLLCSGAVFFKTPTATGVVASVAPAGVTVSASARTFSTI